MKSYFVFFLCLFSGWFSSQTLTSIYFEHNSNQLDQKAKQTLDSLATLKQNLTFRIYGNANPLGTAAHNVKLSENRAEAVKHYLAPKIGEQLKIGSSIGLGTTKQINDNSTEEFLAKNRRVDIFIEKSFLPGEQISRKALRSFLHTPLSRVRVNDTLSLPNLNFEGGRHVWLREAYPTLIRLVDLLKNNQNLEIELQGHICCDYENFDGEDLDLGTFNLSWTRANAVREFLLKENISEHRIKATGMGHLNPVVYPEKTENDRIRNRRVEVVVLKK